MADNKVMGLNLDIEGRYAAWGTPPTPEEVAEAAEALFVVRAIDSKRTMAGYTNDKETAYGKAAVIAIHSMEKHGALVEHRDIHTQVLEFRINPGDRSLVTIQWVKVEDQQADNTTDAAQQE